MKIGQKPELPGAVAQTGIAKQSKGPVATATEEASKGAATASAAGVPVTVSSAARALDSSGRLSGDFDAGRVKAVKAAIEKGEFKVDAEAIADKMLSNAQEILVRARV